MLRLIGLTLVCLSAAIGFGCGISLAQDDAEAARKDRLKVEALMRLKGVDVNKDEKLAGAVRRHLERFGTDPAQLKILRQLNPQGMGPRLLELVAAWQKESLTTEAIQALDLALGQGAKEQIVAMLTQKEPTPEALLVSRVLAMSDNKEALQLFGLLLDNEQSVAVVRSDAAVGLSKFAEGQMRLLEMAKANQLPAESRLIVGAALRASSDESIKKVAEELFPAKKTASAELPPVDALAKRRGNIDNGKTLFDGVATCNQCHTVRGGGKNVGPDLSEIGSKLSREAMYVAILDPSAGISHNYEAYSALLDSGTVVTGLLVSKTDNNIILKDAKGVERDLAMDEIEELKKQEKSLMPDNLQETMSVDGLVDLVEYLISLQKPN